MLLAMIYVSFLMIFFKKNYTYKNEPYLYLMFIFRFIEHKPSKKIMKIINTKKINQ